MKQVRNLGWVALIGLLAAASGPTQDTQEVRSLAALVPEDAFVFGRLDLPRLRRGLEEADLEFEVFREWLRSLGEEDQERPGLAILEVSWEEVFDAVQGETALVIHGDPGIFSDMFGGGFLEAFGTGPPAEDGQREEPEPPMAILMVAGSGQEQLDALLRREAEQAERNGARRSTETFRGTEITIWTRQQEEQVRRGVLASFEGVTVLSNDPEYVRRIVRLATGGEERSLASSERYRAVARGVGDAPFLVYMNLQAIIQPMLESLQQQAEGLAFGEMISSLTEHLGLRELEAFGMGVQVRAGSLSVHGYVHIPRGATGILRAVLARGRVPALPTFTTEDFDLVSTSYIDFAGIYDAFVAMLSPILETQGMSVEDLFSMMGIDPRTDIIDNLSGDFVLLARATGRGEDAQLAPVQLLGLRDADQFRTAIETMLATVAGFGGEEGFEEEEYEGTKIYKMDEQAFAIQGSYAIIGPEESVKEVVSRVGRDGRSLRDHEQFRTLATLVPADRSSEMYMTREGFVRLWEGIRTGNLFEEFASAAQATPFGTPPFGQEEEPEPGENEQQFPLPPVDLFAGNVRAAVGYVQPVEGGTRFVCVVELTRHH